MYDKCYFCLDQLPKLKKESTASFFVNFGRSRGTKEPTYITVIGIGVFFYYEIPFVMYIYVYIHQSLSINVKKSVSEQKVLLTSVRTISTNQSTKVNAN